MLGHYEEAMACYERGGAYRRAVELARRAFPGEVVRLEQDWGDWLMGQRQADAAINHYIEAGESIKALEAALECRQFSKAATIADALDQHAATPYYKRIAKHYDSSGRTEEAERYYTRAGSPAEAVEMLTRAGKWDAAHKVAVGYLSDKEVSHMYVKKANELEASRRFKEAERMYITVKEYDLAINMYKKANMYNEMIRLVSTYRKELLTETHLHLAQKLEGQGLNKQAEQHFLQGKDWQGCINMYRDNDLWDDAIRVAKLYGGVAASKQVAYAWAVRLGGEEGSALLSKFGLVEQAIDYAVESGAFMHAFELANGSMKQKIPEVHLKYAMFLEDEGRFKEAEEEFIKAEKPREAIDMYLHQHDWINAARVAENHDPESMRDISIAQARTCAENQDFKTAETLYLRARRADLLIQAYTQAQMWEDALRIAEEHEPSRIPEVQMALADSSSGAKDGTDSVDNVIARGGVLERNRDYLRAIDVYLSPTAGWGESSDNLERVWSLAVKVAKKHLPERAPEIVASVASKLMSLNRHVSAATLYEGIEAYKEAVDVYIAGGLSDRATSLGSRVGPQLLRYVEERQRTGAIDGTMPSSGLSNNNNNMQTADGGNSLDMYARQGNWDKVHELAAEQGAETATTYTVRHARQEMAAEHYGSAVAVLARHGISIPTKQACETVIAIAKGILSGVGTNADALRQAESDLVDVLYKLNSLKIPDELSRKTVLNHLFAAHLTATKEKCREAGLNELYAKQATSLLRYLGAIPADRAFYEAGMACRAAKKLNMAFVFLNRYLDIAEAIDDPESAWSIENSDFLDTGIPYDFPLPEQHFLNEEQREEVRDWVLALSMDQKVDQSLSTRSCGNCGKEVYEGALECSHCRSESEACIITGYPIPYGERHQPSSLVWPAHRDAWNCYIDKFKACPLTKTVQTDSYA